MSISTTPEHNDEYDGYVAEKEQEFKAEKFYFSFSSLVKLLRDPKLFHNDYILRQREDISAKHLDIGELLHCLVLEPEELEDKFVIMSQKAPGGKIRTVIDAVYKTYVRPMVNANPGTVYTLNDFESELIAEMVEQDAYQNLTDAKRATNGVKLTGDQKRLAKIITPSTQSYFGVLIQGEKKTIVDFDMAQTAHEKAQLILSHEDAMSFMKTFNSKEDVRREMYLEYDLPGYTFGLKGIIDCLKVDYKNETIYISDIKTTSKKLEDWRKGFMESEYMYWLQAIIYKELIQKLIPEDSRGKWKLVFTYIVIDGKNNVYCFNVSAESLREWEFKTKNALDIAKWHLDNHSFNLPYAYERGLVEL